MPGRIVRTQTAARVAEFLATREGKGHLAAHGWTKGMPIVMTQPAESLEDAMAMVSIHGRPVLLAMLDPDTVELQMMYLTPPQSALQIFGAAATGSTTGEFMEQVRAKGYVEFRVRQWQHTAVALAIEPCEGMLRAKPAASRYRVPVRPLTTGG